jgi:ADP-ribose pyrophosphatase
VTKPFEVVDSKITYRGRVLDVRQDRVRLPDGGTADLDVVAHSGAVTILPLDQEGQIWFVRQYRHAAGEMLLELPAGTLEEKEDPAECAGREVREETGMGAEHLRLLGEFFLAPGYSTEYMYVFLATGLFSAPLAADSDEYLSVERVPVQQVYQLALGGTIRDAKTLAALLLARPFLLSDG